MGLFFLGRNLRICTWNAIVPNIPNIGVLNQGGDQQRAAFLIMPSNFSLYVIIIVKLVRSVVRMSGKKIKETVYKV